MYFWRVDALKSQMRSGPVPQSDVLGYILISMFLFAAGSGVPGLWNARTEPAHGAEWAGYAISLALVVIGTVGAYRANGGRDGADFAARYMAMTWVVGVRLFVLGLIPGIVAVLALTVVAAAVNPEDSRIEAFSVIGFVVFSVALEALFYWRVAHHLGSVRDTMPLANATQ